MEKVFAVIRNNIIEGMWAAASHEEAQSDNPDAKLVEVTIENSPWYLGDVYEEGGSNG